MGNESMLNFCAPRAFRGASPVSACKQLISKGYLPNQQSRVIESRGAFSQIALIIRTLA